MGIMGSVRAAQVVALALGVISGCNAIFGIGDLSYEASGTGGNATSSTGGNATSGSGGHAMGGSGGAMTSASGDGGSASDDCGGCPPGQKCSIVDYMLGEVGCVEAGQGGAWQQCQEDSQCATGLWCDNDWLVCRPTCPDDKCGSGKCMDATSFGMKIPGWRVCAANCEPFMDVPCDQKNGPTTCIFRDSASVWDCIASDGKPLGASCSTQRECGTSVNCRLNGICSAWCSPPAAGGCAIHGLGDCEAMQNPQYFEG